MDRLEADLGAFEELLDLPLVLPDEGDGDTAVGAHLTRAGHEPRRQAGPLEDALCPHRVFGGKEGDDPAPSHATVLIGSVLRPLRARERIASAAVSISSSLVS